MISDLSYLAAEAKRRADDYEAFRYFVELDERSDEALDALVDEIAAPIIAAIDCTECANCCRSLTVYVTEADAHHLAAGNLIPVEQIIETYIDREQAQTVEEWGMFKQSPCAFLRDKRCSLYEHRPESCRIYPVFTPDFRWTLEDILGGVGLCPIIYNVVEELQKTLGW